MVNWFPFQYVGLSRTNNKYRAVRTAATALANAKNRKNYTDPTDRNQAVLFAKRILQNKINEYMNDTPGAPPAPARAGFFSRFRRAPPVRIGEMPAPGTAPRNIAGALGPLQPSPVNKQINGARVRANATTNNYQPANVFLYQGKFYSPHNGRYTEVKRNGMTGANFTKHKASNINGRYNRQNVNGKPVFTPFTGENPANVANRTQFGKFMMLAPSIGSNTVNKQAKNYLNGNNRYRNNSGPVNFNAVRRITKNTNSNAATRTPFWNAVNAEMARRAAAKSAFNAWYAAPASGANPANKARAYVALIKNANANPTNASRRAAIIRRINNVNNAGNPKNRGNFWTTVNTNLAANTSRATDNKSWSKWLANRWAFE
jgi:hypothetical protein